MSFSIPGGGGLEDLSDPEDIEGHGVLGRLTGRIRAPDVRSQFSRLRESAPSDEEGDSSPFGSPREGDGFAARDKFLELKRRLEEDQKNRPRISTTSYEDNYEFSGGEFDLDELMAQGEDDQDFSHTSSASILPDLTSRFRDMHDKIKEKDLTLMNLETRVKELDREVASLKSTISERDKTLASKEDSVSVVEEKFKKIIAKKDLELSKTQTTLFGMEKILSSSQVQWKSEKESLNNELQNQTKKLEALQDKYNVLETKQYDLSQYESEIESLRNAVQEKAEEVNNKDSEIENLNTSLETSKGQVNKLKAQYQNKLKSIKAHNKESSEKSSEKITEMENRLAELEEEKGNLCLQLVDLDEQQAMHSSLLSKVDELEQQVKTDEETISSLGQEVSLLNEEKETLNLVIQKREEENEQLRLCKSDTEQSTEQCRVTLELRVVELEDQRDTFQQEAQTLREKLDSVELRLTEVRRESTLPIHETSSTSVCTDTQDLLNTTEQTTETTTGYDQNTIGAKRARLSSGNQSHPAVPETEEPVLASSLFASSESAPPQFQQTWSGWEDPAPQPAAFQNVSLNEDIDEIEGSANSNIANVFNQPESNYFGGSVANVPLFEENQWGGWGGFEDNVDTFVQVKNPFAYEVSQGSVSGSGEAEIQNLQAQLRTSTSLCEKLKIDLANKNMECEKLEEEVEKLHVSLRSGGNRDRDVEEEIQAKSAQLDELHSELNETKEALRTKEIDLESTGAIVVQVRAELDEKLNQIANCLQVIESFKDGMTEKDALVSKLRNEIENSELLAQEKSGEVNDLMTRLEENSRTITSLRNDLKNSQLKHEELLNNLEERETSDLDQAALKNQNKQMRDDLCQRDEELGLARNQIRQYEELLDSNESELVDLRNREQDMIGGYQKISADFDALQIIHEDLKSSLESVPAKTPFKEDESQGKETATHLQTLLNERESEIQTLSEKLVKVEGKLKKAMVMLKQKNLKMAELQKSSTSSPGPVYQHEEHQLGSGPTSLSPLPAPENQKEIERLQTECSEKATGIENLQKAIQDLHLQMNEISIARQQALDVVSQQEHQILQLNGLLTNYESEIITVKDELQTKADAMARVQGEVQGLYASLSDAQCRLQDTESMLTAKTTELESIVKHNEDLFNEAQAHRDGLQESIQAKNKDIASLEARIEEILAQNEPRIDSLENEVWEKNNMLTQLNSDISSLQLRIGFMEQEKENLEKILEMEKSEKEKLVESLEVERQEREMEVTQHLETLQQKDSRIHELGDQVARLESNHEEAEQSQKEIEKWQTECSEKVSRLENMEKVIQELQGQIHEISFTKEQTGEILTTQENRIAELQSLLSSQESEILLLKENVNSKTNEMEKAKIEIHKLGSELNDAQYRLKDSEAMLNLKSKDLDSMVSLEVLNEVRLERDALQESVQTLHESIQSKTQDIFNLELKMEEMMSQVQSQPQIQLLEKELWDKNNIVTHLNSEISALQHKIGFMENEHLSLGETLNMERTEKESLFGRLEEMRLEKETLSEKLEEMRQEKESYENEIKSLDKPTTTISPKGKAVSDFFAWDDQVGGGISQPTQGGDWWSGGAQGNVQVEEERIVKKTAFETNDLGVDLQTQYLEALQQKDARIYEMEVQIANLEISIQDANSQKDDLADDLELSRTEITRLRAETHSLTQEIEKIRREKAQIIAESERRESVPPRTIQEVPQTQDGNTSSFGEEERNKLMAEYKEMKVKNGKLMLRIKQLTDKFNTLSKECEGLKAKNQFSLDGTFADEFMTQMNEKNEALAESTKLLAELQSEKEKMTDRIDILERANDRMVEMHESQSAYCNQLTNQKKQLEQEISGLKWRLEEVENMQASEHVPATTNQEYPHAIHETPVQVQQQQQESMIAAAQEIQFLQQENNRLNSIVQNLSSAISDEGPQAILTEDVINQTQTVFPSAPTSDNPDIANLQKKLDEELSDKLILERKIELLQAKILEIEQSEIKCFEESIMMKSWTRQLEMDNLKYQKEMEQIYNSVSDGDTNNLKVKTLQNEVVRLVETLHERDRRCEELTLEITRLLEERDGLQLKLSNVLSHNVSMHEEANKGKESPTSDTEIPTFDKEALQMKLTELEGVNFCINMDLRREKEARRLVQEQLLFSQSSRVYRDLTSRNKITFSSPPSSPSPKVWGTPSTPLPQQPPSPPAELPVSPISTPSSHVQI